MSPARKRPAGRGGGRSRGTPKARPQARTSAAGRGRRAAPAPATKRAPVAKRAAVAKKVARATAPKGLGGEQVEGRQAVRELLLAGRRKVREVWIAAELDESGILADIRELAASVRVPVREVSKGKLQSQARTEAPQGVLALAAPLPEADLDELVAKRRSGAPPFLLALDGVTDPGNVGAVLRSAEGAGVTGVILPRHRAVHITPTVTKAAAGAVEHLPIALVGGLPAALARCREAGCWIVGLDAVAERQLFDLDELGTEPVVLVLGAEGSGLSRLVRERCDVVASIPLRGRISSLNVAAAGTLACYEVARRRLRPSG